MAKCNWCGKEKNGVETGICEHCGRFGKSSETVVQQSLSGSADASPKCSHCNDDPGWKSYCVNPNCKNYAT